MTGCAVAGAGRRPFLALAARALHPHRDYMRSVTIPVLYVLVLAAIIIAVDVLLFRNRFWPRLAFNVGIALVFAAVYFRFARRP